MKHKTTTGALPNSAGYPGKNMQGPVEVEILSKAIGPINITPPTKGRYSKKLRTFKVKCSGLLEHNLVATNPHSEPIWVNGKKIMPGKTKTIFKKFK